MLELPTNSIAVWRVGDIVRPLHTYNIAFFAESLDYYRESKTGYRPEDAKKYILILKGSKIFDPIREWKLRPNCWCDIRTTEEFCIKHNIPVTEYLDIDYDDPNIYHEVLLDTETLAVYGRDHGYDLTILRDIPNGGGEGNKCTEYAVHNIKIIKNIIE